MWHLGNQTVALAEGTGSLSDFVVALVGYLAIFAVLTVIYITCLVIGKVTSKPKAKTVSIKTASEATEPAVKPLSEFADRRAAVAAISAAIAEELGEDVSRIRITSIKKIG
jgi:Na+-transporting methylmalonyl-CoA/oxaloacetate decarboxylase gamma subunit